MVFRFWSQQGGEEVKRTSQGLAGAREENKRAPNLKESQAKICIPHPMVSLSLSTGMLGLSAGRTQVDVERGS